MAAFADGRRTARVPLPNGETRATPVAWDGRETCQPGAIAQAPALRSPGQPSPSGPFAPKLIHPIPRDRAPGAQDFAGGRVANGSKAIPASFRLCAAAFARHFKRVVVAL